MNEKIKGVRELNEAEKEIVNNFFSSAGKDSSQKNWKELRNKLNIEYYNYYWDLINKKTVVMEMYEKHGPFSNNRTNNLTYFHNDEKAKDVNKKDFIDWFAENNYFKIKTEDNNINNWLYFNVILDNLIKLSIQHNKDLYKILKKINNKNDFKIINDWIKEKTPQTTEDMKMRVFIKPFTFLQDVNNNMEEKYKKEMVESGIYKNIYDGMMNSRSLIDNANNNNSYILDAIDKCEKTIGFYSLKKALEKDSIKQVKKIKI